MGLELQDSAEAERNFILLLNFHLLPAKSRSPLDIEGSGNHMRQNHNRHCKHATASRVPTRKLLYGYAMKKAALLSGNDRPGGLIYPGFTSCTYSTNGCRTLHEWWDHHRIVRNSFETNERSTFVRRHKFRSTSVISRIASSSRVPAGPEEKTQ